MFYLYSIPTKCRGSERYGVPIAISNILISIRICHAVSDPYSASVVLGVKIHIGVCTRTAAYLETIANPRHFPYDMDPSVCQSP